MASFIQSLPQTSVQQCPDPVSALLLWRCSGGRGGVAEDLVKPLVVDLVKR